MANIVIKSEKFTPFGGIFPIMEQFDSMISCAIRGGAFDVVLCKVLINNCV